VGVGFRLGLGLKLGYHLGYILYIKAYYDNLWPNNTIISIVQ